MNSLTLTCPTLGLQRTTCDRGSLTVLIPLDGVSPGSDPHTSTRRPGSPDRLPEGTCHCAGRGRVRNVRIRDQPLFVCAPERDTGAILQTSRKTLSLVCTPERDTGVLYRRPERPSSRRTSARYLPAAETVPRPGTWPQNLTESVEWTVQPSLWHRSETQGQ